MPTYFAAGGIDAYQLSPTQPRNNGDGSINLTGNSSAYADAVLIDPASAGAAAITRLWTHAAFDPDSGVYDGGCFPITWQSSAGTDVVQAEGNGNHGMTFRYRAPDGTWATVGSFGGLYGGSLDALIAIDPAAGRIALFWNGGLLTDLNGINTSAIGNLSRMRFRGASGYDYQGLSNVIAASYSTIGHSVRVRRPSAAGAETGWTGDVSAISKGNLDDSTTIGADTVGATATFTGPTLSATPAGNVVKAVAIGARVRNDDSAAPQNIRALLRINGVDYPASRPLSIGPGFAGAVSIFDLDPVTGAPWTSIDDANAEFGFQAVQ